MELTPTWKQLGLERAPEDMTYEELLEAYVTIMRFKTYDRLLVLYQRRMLERIERLAKGNPVKVYG